MGMLEAGTRRARTRPYITLLLLWGTSGFLVAEGVFTLSFEAPARIIEPAGSRRFETCFTVLSHEGEGTGAQGWSYGVESLGCSILAATTEGTAAEAESFIKTQIIDAAKNSGRTGFVSATVLHVAGGDFELSPRASHRIAKLAVEFTVAEEEATAVLNFEEGLRGGGQPVAISVSQAGDAVKPVWIDHTITLAPPFFLRGDASSDGKLDIGDALSILEWLFRTWRPAPCEDASDANDDGRLDISDPIHILGYLFLGSDPPAAPHPECGPDPTLDAFGCTDASHCWI
jgi:hypothetical protein